MFDYLTARELAAKVRAGEVSAAETVDDFLDRLDARNPALNAVVSVDADRARRLAARRDADPGLGGPLQGVPMTIKDAFDVAGLRTTLGATVLDHLATRSSTVAARLEGAGAIIVGHSNVPSFLADYKTDNEIFGRTSNPWATDRTPGGSSGGAAAALAAGITPLDIGSDVAGSLRLPPHFCGVYGLKTTEHRVPLTGFYPLPDETPRTVRVMCALGPLARDLDDLDVALRVIAGPDGVDFDVAPAPLAERREIDLTRVRLTVVPALPGGHVAPSLHARVGQIAAAASDVGVQVTDSLPAIDFSALRIVGDLIDAISEILGPGARHLNDAQRSLSWYLTALGQRDRFAAAFATFFDDHDAILLPAGTTTAFHHDSDWYGDLGGLLVFANFAGLPALTAPAGLDDDGLPMGVQLVGPRWSETRLLDIAAALEEAQVLPGFRRPPGY